VDESNNLVELMKHLTARF